MPRPRRSAAAKAVKYNDDPLSDEVDDEDAALTDAGESASGASSSRKGGVHKAQDDEAWSQGDDSDDAPARKKARTSTSSSSTKGKGTSKGKSKGKGRAGKLSAFLAMPLDILVEISRHLDPPSLLSMSRANKMMRGVFAHRSAAPIWAIVRGNVDLPQLEATDLSEMQLASLVFERNCHLCGRGRASIVDYALRVRWCKKCQRANLDNQSRIRRKVEDLHVNAFECSPFTFHSLSGYNSGKNPYYCTPDVERISAQLYEVEGKAPKKPRKAKKKKSKKRKYEDEDDESDEEVMDEDDVAKLEAFVKQRHDIVAASQRDAVALVKWERSSITARRESGDAARQAREEAIRQKLLALGYSDADCIINPYSSVWNLVDQPTKLTNSIWTRISPKIIEHVEAQKKRRIASETASRCRIRHAAVQGRYELLLAAEKGEAYLTFPSPSMFAALPSVEPFWVPEGATLTDDAWAAALPAILDEVKLARRAIKVGYARNIVKVLVEAGAPIAAALVKKLEPSETAPVRPIGVLRDAAENHDMVRFGFSSLDLADTADHVGDAELDALFSRLSATFLSTKYNDSKLEHFPDIHRVLRDNRRAADVSDAVLPTVCFVKEVLDILKRTSLPDDRSSRRKLERLGPVFRCHGCDPERLDYDPFYFGRGARASDRSENLYWSDMMEHVTSRHRDTYMQRYMSPHIKHSEIRLSTSTYPPVPLQQPVPARKPATPFVPSRDPSSIEDDELEAWFDAASSDKPSTSGDIELEPVDDELEVADYELEAWYTASRFGDESTTTIADDEFEAWFDEASVDDPTAVGDDELEAWLADTGLDGPPSFADDDIGAWLDAAV
ncbi:uncharacterized protein RHOBADRAFT_52048 [Rhodotorula graminis WP1]|uniref:F-box domain-containing protein n=1 Tax=Rhodotorula graminis (strain WP1) TaxID=578459 RepID=A0A194S8P2_RHOGW|nr:uncharacterized protein RHOBADRAFT_52048 [Rhodotorula graminis WP1]KPV77093.1 hypothetical protein RHOBADRAFT_52048 [Rhodotorula graminis WP1]